MMALTVIHGSQEVKEEEASECLTFSIFLSFFFHSLSLNFEDYVPHILFILMVVRLNEDH